MPNSQTARGGRERRPAMAASCEQFHVRKPAPMGRRVCSLVSPAGRRSWHVWSVEARFSSSYPMPRKPRECESEDIE